MTEHQDHELGTAPQTCGPGGGAVPFQQPRGPQRHLTPPAHRIGGRAASAPAEEIAHRVELGVTLYAEPLMRVGWTIIGRDSAAVLRDVEDRWPRTVAPPRIEARPSEDGRLWWHWAAPASVADEAIAPLNHHDQTLRILLATLPELTAAARRVPAP